MVMTASCRTMTRGLLSISQCQQQRADYYKMSLKRELVVSISEKFTPKYLEIVAWRWCSRCLRWNRCIYKMRAILAFCRLRHKKIFWIRQVRLLDSPDPKYCFVPQIESATQLTGDVHDTGAADDVTGSVLDVGDACGMKGVVGVNEVNMEAKRHRIQHSREFYCNKARSLPAIVFDVITLLTKLLEDPAARTTEEIGVMRTKPE